MSAAGFGPHFHSWIHLLNAYHRVMVEVNGVRSKLFTLTCLIHQSCPRSLMLYILALESFLHELKANPVLHGLMLPDSTEVVRYTAYTDDITMLVMSSAKVVEVSKEIRRYEVVMGAKTNHAKSIGLQLGSWKGCALPGPFSWKDGLCKILGIWLSPNIQLEKNWIEVLEKIVAVTELWLCRQLSLKG